MIIWQKEKISVEKLQKKLNLRESKLLDVLLNDVSAKMLCLSEFFRRSFGELSENFRRTFLRDSL